VLLGGVPGVPKGNVLVLGAGIVGTEAAKMAAGLGANVTIMDVNLNRLRYFDTVMPANVSTRFSSDSNIEELLPHADLVLFLPLKF
jgi:alanine dehydrogenase